MPIERNILNHRRPHNGVYLAVVTAVALAAFFGGRVTAPEPPQRGDRAAAEPSLPATIDPAAGAPTRDGAVMAATTFARIMGSIRSGDTRYVDALVEIAAPDWRDDARRLAKNGLAFVTEQYGAKGAVMFEPIRYMLLEFDGATARVAIWGVVLSNPTDAMDATWGTGTIELKFFEGEWRMTGGESTPGPTPHQQKPEDTVPVSSLNGYSEYNDGPRP
jgi:hypothetical protein